VKVSDWLGKSEFQGVVSEPGPHVVVFAAKWCHYCSNFLEQIKSSGNPTEVEINLIDTDEPDESLWDDYSIERVPTIIVFKDGKSIFRKDARSPLSLSGGGLKMADLEQGLSALS